jgi:hypothetical protein
MRATAAIAGLLVLLAGFGVGTYFVAFRTAGVQPPSASLELGIVAGAVALLALLTFLAVLSGAKRAGGGSVQRLLQRALEIDATDPDTVRQFAPVPALRDLVAHWMSERAHVRELGDRVEMLRGELDGIADGMRRSAQDLGRIREQPSNPLGVQIVATWNTMVERLKQAESKAAEAVSTAAAPAAAPLGPSSEPIVRTLVARLDELESELDRLRGHVGDAPALEILDAGTESARNESAPRARPPVAAAPLELERRAEAPRSRTPASDDRWGEVEVVEPLPRTQSWQVVADDDSSLFVPEPSAQPPAPATAPPPAVQPGDPRFEDLHFPHFVGKPVGGLEDRVAVTYEGQDAAAEVAELPAHALLFDDEPPVDELPVFDLDRLSTPERER